MPTYAWEAITAKGKTKKGFGDADSAKSLCEDLRKDQLFVTTIESTNTRTGSKKSSIKNLSGQDVVAITRQFAILLKSGLPIDVSLQAMAAQTNKIPHKKLLKSIHAKINEGHTFAKTLEAFPNIFPKFYIATVSAGEKTGKIGLVLERLGEYLHTAQTTKQKIVSALTYPAIIILVAIAAISTMLSFVVPSIAQVFASANQDLPTITTVVIGLSNLLVEWGLVFLVFLLVNLLLFKQMLKRQSFQAKYHRFLLKLPIVRKLIIEQNTSRFIRTLGILLESRVDFFAAMKIATDIVEIVPINQSLQHATKMVREGSSVFIALNKTGFFSPITLNLISSGEKSGALPEMLLQSADGQDQNLINRIALFVGIFEPVVILIMGGIVLIIVLAILLPIFDMNNLVQ